MVSAPAATAVLYCNLGTPASPTVRDVRRYLREFLSDRRIVDMSRPLWWLLLHGVILPTRPQSSAAKYAHIWTEEGSPLLVWTQRQGAGLQAALARRGHAVTVYTAMRYGQPAIPAALDALQEQGVRRVLIVPAYPQYSSTTTASVNDAVGQWAAAAPNQPEFRSIRSFGDDDRYIAALAATVRRHWAQHGQPDVLLMSFHGLPQRTVDRGDPYRDECLQTAQKLAQALALSPPQYRITFQSRVGWARWLEPYTEATLVELARQGIRRVDVVCPSFVCDCLETLEEIGHEARTTFLAAGGQWLGCIPSLNDNPEWIAALASLVEDHLQGWPTDGS
ncbi:ferrochelatase [Candidatus Symbiobacter mobilis]|uniref:Ferrochelatase n=1 Tax=Candidatus Symbiobacter mobilis CR TaxID=946483 RepID=U5N4X2_9BURK|nr:ferrochelatase [Candidatus Symbiobacter mobilis]AGX86551.1 ferrochelatase [Candidatus Symbiobacter mobilis CR]